MIEENEITEEIRDLEESFNNNSSNSLTKTKTQQRPSEDQTNSQNIYTDKEEEPKEEIKDANLVDFTQENLSIFKDSFKASKITQTNLMISLIK